MPACSEGRAWAEHSVLLISRRSPNKPAIGALRTLPQSGTKTAGAALAARDRI